MVYSMGGTENFPNLPEPEPLQATDAEGAAKLEDASQQSMRDSERSE